MSVCPAGIPDVKLFEPKVFGDERGFFFESYNKKVLAAAGVTCEFVQDNHSRSARNVLRGLHYQIQQPQGKLVRVVAGEILDIAVDLRRSSPSFGQHVAYVLSAANKRVIWIPPGFAHGFLVKSEYAECVYKTTDYYAPEHERTLLWNDPALAIEWDLRGEPILSPKDWAGRLLSDCDVYP